MQFSGKTFKKHRLKKFAKLSDFVAEMAQHGMIMTWVALNNWEKKSVTPRSDLYLVACRILDIKPEDCFDDKKQKKRKKYVYKNANSRRPKKLKTQSRIDYVF